MTREEREEYVVQLYKENNSIRQIANLVHMSFRDIGVIINRAKLQAERERGLGEKEIIKVLELAKYDELENLQWKVEYLRNEVNLLEKEKWKSTNQILKLYRMIDEF